MNETTTDPSASAGLRRERALTEAIGHYVSAIELDPTATGIRIELSGVYRSRSACRRARGDLEGALGDLLSAREHAPRDEVMTLALANACAEVAQALLAPVGSGRVTVRVDASHPNFVKGIMKTLELLQRSSGKVHILEVHQDEMGVTFLLPDLPTLKATRLQAALLAGDNKAPMTVRVNASQVFDALQAASSSRPGV